MVATDVREVRGEIPLERIEAELTELSGQLAAGECRWLLLVGEYDRREGYLQWGCRSCVQWLSWQCGLDGRSARDKLRVARALEHLPVVTREFAAGRLSYSKVRALHAYRHTRERGRPRRPRRARDGGAGGTRRAGVPPLTQVRRRPPRR